MRHSSTIAVMAFALAAPLAFAQGLTAPDTVHAGAAFSLQTTGSGSATLFIVGMGQVFKQVVQLGGAIEIPAGTVYNAGHYLAIVSTSSQAAPFDVTPAQVADVSFLARPSRLPVGLHSGITGAVYVFDAYKNLVTAPTNITFELETPAGAKQQRTAMTRNGMAWVAMDSSPKEGAAHFVASAGGVSSTRVIAQVPGDPCGLRMNAKADGQKIALETDPVKDCSGNAVPDGTVVTFTESFDGGQSTVDVPLKRGVAKVEMPAHPGASLSVASGVVLGNQIRWGR